MACHATPTSLSLPTTQRLERQQSEQPEPWCLRLLFRIGPLVRTLVLRACRLQACPSIAHSLAITARELSHNQLTSLPAGIFDSNLKLTRLYAASVACRDSQAHKCLTLAACCMAAIWTTTSWAASPKASLTRTRSCWSCTCRVHVVSKARAWGLTTASGHRQQAVEQQPADLSPCRNLRLQLEAGQCVCSPTVALLHSLSLALALAHAHTALAKRRPLHNNQLATLPAGIFDSMTQTKNMYGAPPLPHAPAVHALTLTLTRRAMSRQVLATQQPGQPTCRHIRRPTQSSQPVSSRLMGFACL